MEGGSFGTFNQRASFGGSQENFNYIFNVQHLRSTDTPVTPLNQLAPGEHRNNDNYDNWTYSTKLGASLTDTFGVNLVARYTQSVLGFIGEDAVNFFPPAPEPLQSTQTDKQFFGRGEAVWSLFDGRFKNFFGVNYTNEWSHNVDPNPDSFTAPPLVAPPTTNLGQRTQVDWRGEARVIPGQTFVFGLEDKKETLSTDSTGAFNAAGIFTPFTTNASTGDKAAWFELQSQFWNRLFIVSNIRYDDNESFGPHTTWRIAPTYIVPWTETKLKATYGTGFKAPTLTELYVNFPAFNSVANPNLAPETSTGFDVGFEQPLLHDQVAFGATYFHNDITNLIVGTFDPVTFISSFANVGQATTQGVEAFAAGIVNPRLRLRADYTYTEARDDTTGLALLRRPVNKASLSAIWYPIDKMTVTTTFLYVSPWVDVDRSTFVRIVQPGYELARVAAEYTLTDNWTLFGRIENLFNVQYEDPAGFLRPGFGVYGGVRLDIGAGSWANPPIVTKTARGT